MVTYGCGRGSTVCYGTIWDLCTGAYELEVLFFLCSGCCVDCGADCHSNGDRCCPCVSKYRCSI